LIGLTTADERVVKDRFQEAAAFGLGAGELCVQSVAQCHEPIDLSDDALLFA
jgi:hypothetical protein